MPAIPYSDTAVVDGAWDGPGNEAKIPNTATASTFRKMYAWVDPSKDADTKAAYKFPHHFVSDGTPGAASVNGVRAALARASQSGTNIPDGDRGAVKGHLQKHLDKYNGAKKSEAMDEYIRGSVEILTEEDVATLHQATMIEARGKVLLLPEHLVEDVAAMHGKAITHFTWFALTTSARTLKPSNGASPEDARVEVIPLKGVLRPTPSLFGLLFGGGGGGLMAFREQLRKATADSKVAAIVMDVDSPGGFVDLIPETAADIRAARAVKPVVAVANTTAASAAYWLASQASQVVVTPSGDLGSIGVYQIHENLSGALAKEGVEVTIVKAGKYKIEGHPFAPLNDEAAASMQANVNGYYDMFTADVAKGRGVTQDEVKNGYGEGRTLPANGNRAVKAGLADRVEQLGETVKRLAHPGARAALQRADAEALEEEILVELPPPSEPSEEAMAIARARFAAQRLTPEERVRVLSVLAG